MTLGQFLSAHSPLPSGTVIQHLQALQIGGGASSPVYCTGLAVRHEVEELTVTSATKPDLTVFRQGKSSVLTARRKDADLLTAQISRDSLDVFLGAPGQLYARRETATSYTKKG